MHMPSFTPEAGLGRTFGLYRGGPTIQAPGAPAIIPAFDWIAFGGPSDNPVAIALGAASGLGSCPNSATAAE